MAHARPAILDSLERTFRSKPLVFFLAAWVAGILAADHASLSFLPSGLIGLGCVAGSPAVRARWLSLFLLLIGVSCLGLGATRLALTPPRGDVSEWSGRQVVVHGSVEAEPARRCDSWRYLVRVEAVTYAGQRVPAQGRLSLRTKQDLGSVEPGSGLRVSGVPERPAPARNPGGFSQELWLSQQGIFATLTARPGAVAVARQLDDGWDWRRWAAQKRRRIAVANRQIMHDPDAASLVNSLLFGDLDQDDEQEWSALEERFRRAGLSHVLVVSGAQVALVFGLLFGWRRWALRRHRGVPGVHRRLLRRLGGYSQRQALAGGLALLVPYVMLAGLQPSVVRAALLAGILFVARCLDRETDPENSLAAAALVLLVANPLTLYDVGAQLSFAAVWTIVRGAEPIARSLGREQSVRKDSLADRMDRGVPAEFALRLVTVLLRLGAALLAMTLAAELATAPILAQQFQQFSVVSTAANVPACLMATVLLPLGLFSSVVNAVAAPSVAANLLTWPTEQLARAINACVTWFAGPTWAMIPVQPPGWAAIALYAALLLAASTPAARSRRWASPALTLLALGVLAAAILRPAAPVRVPTLTFLDVGQGDACLIRLPEGANILVDGGGSPRASCTRPDCGDVVPGTLADSIRTDCLDVGRDVLADFLRHEHIQRIDLMVLTHPHDDHLWGLDALLDPREGFEISKVLDAERWFDTPAYREWWKLLQRRGLTPDVARRGMRLAIGPAQLTVLHPPDRFLSHTHSDENNNSIVLRLEWAGAHVLLTGDAEAAAEASMAGEDVHAEVLKVGHHGSASSTSDAWLERVRPRIAVISCGAHNPFGHPSPATLERLRRHGVQVYRTDWDGAVTLELRPSGWVAGSTIRLAAWAQRR
jgi:competence protein ComEC